MAKGILHFGAFEGGGAAGDVMAADCFQGVPIVLSGTADAINFRSQFNNNFIVTTGSADAITLPLPIAGTEDNLSVAIYSATAFAHTVTLPSAQFANGAALATVATFKAFAGSGITLRAWNGTWQVIASNVTSIS